MDLCVFITYLDNILKVAQLLQGWILQHELNRTDFFSTEGKVSLDEPQALKFPRWQNQGSAWRCKKLGKTWGRFALNLFEQQCKNFPYEALSDARDVKVYGEQPRANCCAV